MSKEQKILDKYKSLHIGGVSVSLPSVDNSGIIAVEISEMDNEMTTQEQSFFIAGFQECIKYLEMQSNSILPGVIGNEADICPLCNNTGEYSYGGSFGGVVMTQKCNCRQT